MSDRGLAVFVVTLIFTILGTVFTALRLISRGLIVRRLSWGDALVVVAWVSDACLLLYGHQVAVTVLKCKIVSQVGACLASIAIMVATFSGLGKRNMDIDDEDKPLL